MKVITMPLLISLGVILITIGIIIGIRQKQLTSSQIVLIGGVITIIAGALTTFGSYLQTRENDVQSNRLETKVDKSLDIQTGSNNNKPFLIIQFEKLDNGFYESHFALVNFGKYRLTNIDYQINDPITTTSKFLNEKKIESLGKMSEKQVEESWNYKREHAKEEEIINTLSHLPKNGVREIYEGLIPKGEEVVSYNAVLNWNEDYYSVHWEFELNAKSQVFEITNWNLTDSSNRKIINLNNFFPLVPKVYLNQYPELKE